MLTGSRAAASALFMRIPSTPCSIVTHASEAVPTPASTTTGTLSRCLMIRMPYGFRSPRFGVSVSTSAWLCRRGGGRRGGAGAGELAGLGHQRAPLVPDLGLLVEPAAVQQAAVGDAGQPAGCRPAADVGGQRDGRRPGQRAERDADRGHR